MIKDMKVGIIVAAWQALEYKKKKPGSDIDEIMQYVTMNVEANDEAKKGVIVGVSRAMKYWDKNPKLQDKEIIQRVMDDINEIVKNIREEEY